eukprot:453465-Pyramimonas_sp.AAC.1
MPGTAPALAPRPVDPAHPRSSRGQAPGGLPWRAQPALAATAALSSRPPRSGGPACRRNKHERAR